MAVAGGWAMAAAPPNIVVVLVDDMGVMDTSVPFLTDAHGRPVRHRLNDFYRTPAMERLAARGIRFNQFSAMSVCSPTRLSLMTGQNPARHRTTNWINPDRDNRGPRGPQDWNWQGLQPDDVTLASLLSDRGYRSIHIGKGHFAPRHLPGADPANLGFAVNVAGGSFGAPGSYYATDNFGWGTRREHHAVPHLQKYHGSETYLTEALAIEALDQVSAAVADELPFFLYLSHYAVHAPFQADPRFADHYSDSEMPPAAQAFATMIEGMDKSLGDLLDRLDQLGVAENTLVFFLGDNGTDAPLGHQHQIACAAPLRGKKGSHYEGGTRVPMIAAWAADAPDAPHQRRLPIPSGAIQHQMADVCDLMPTILSVAGVTPPAGHVIDGKPLQPLLMGEHDPQRQDSFLMHYPHAPHRSEHWTSYRQDDWKVVYHYFPSEASGGGHHQLFDLAEDPSESSNLADSDPAQLRRMMGELVKALDRHDALYPVDEDGAELRPKMP